MRVQVADVGFLANPGTQVFHRPFCYQARNIHSPLEFCTSKDATEAGFRPCRNCKPDELLLGNERSHVVHLEGCRHLRRIKHTALRPFETLTAALDEGFWRCGCLALSGIQGFLRLRPPEVAEVGNLAHLYVHIAWIELQLHYAVRRVLQAVHGENWWKKGVPRRIRLECVTRKEELGADEDPYDFVDLIHDFDIIDKNWNLFSNAVPRPVSKNLQTFRKNYRQLNELRNQIMHPNRGRTLDAQAGELVSTIAASLDLRQWRFSRIESA